MTDKTLPVLTPGASVADTDLFLTRQGSDPEDRKVTGTQVKAYAQTGVVLDADYDAHTILAATTDNTPAALTVPEQTLVGRITSGNIDALTASEVRTLLNVEDGADVTDATNVAAAGAVMEADYNANTILAATTDDTPVALTVPEQTLVGRITSGSIDALTATEVRTLINVEDGADVTDEANVVSALDGATLSDIGTPASGDRILIQDADDSNNLKYAAFSEFGGGGSGTVTSVAVSGTDGLQVDSGSPITTSGTIALGVDAAALLSHINVEAGADVTDETNVVAALNGATLSNIGTPASGDQVLILDVDDSGNLKYAAASTLGGGGGGSVTSVAVTGSDGIQVDSGSPITSSGTIALGIDASALRTHINVEDGADVTDATNVAAAGAVMDSDYDANTILAATTDNTPVALTVAEQTLVGRITAGNIDALTASEVRTLINVEDGADVTDSANVISSLSGASITTATVADTDKVLIQDADDSDNLKTVTAQAIANLADTVDINGGTIDNTVIGGATPAAGTFTTATATDVVTEDVQASGSAGVVIKNSGGTSVATIGPANGTGSSFAGGLTVDGNLAVDTSLLYVDSSADKVGIGATAPQGKVEIVSSSSGAVTDALVLANPNGLSAGTGVALYFDPNGAGALVRAAGIKSRQVASGNFADLGFFTANSDTPVERMTISAAGNVGIGTTSPATKLDVNGTLKASGLTYPTADGTNGQVLQTNGSGTLSFATVAGGGGSIEYYRGRVTSGTSGYSTMTKVAMGASDEIYSFATDPIDADGLFVAPSDGIYYIIWTADMNLVDADASCTVRIVQAGSVAKSFQQELKHGATNNSPTGATLAILLDMDASDTFELRMQIDLGTSGPGNDGCVIVMKIA